MVQSCSVWILWLTCLLVHVHIVRLQSLVFNNLVDARDGLCCCLSLDLFDLEFLGRYFPLL